jgi:DNA-binding LytR/AlgR family response regulator
MNALIIEDEIEAAERLKVLIHEQDPEITILQMIDTVQDAVAFFASGRGADIIFMDIQLADGKSFEIFDQIRIDVPIIFTTAFDQYALRAFKQFSIAYLLKPIQREDLGAALTKLRKVVAPALTPLDIMALKELINVQNKFKQRLLVKTGNKLLYKPVTSIAFFFAEGKSAFLVGTGDGRKCMIDHTLEELENMLDPRQFFRISRKHIVNFESIVEIRGSVSSRLEVRIDQPCAHQLFVSRERVHAFKEWMDR